MFWEKREECQGGERKTEEVEMKGTWPGETASYEGSHRWGI